MKIICKWVYKGYIDGVKIPQLKVKQKDISDLSGRELLEMVTDLLALDETERIIIEEGKKE